MTAPSQGTPDEKTHEQHDADVIIIGGGPAGSTAATLLRKYNPDMRVLILEKAKFPREHVGESQLPGISAILDEMGVWDRVEAAGFPIKIGASYTWGQNDEVWDFDFYPAEEFIDEPRPAKFKGQRKLTAFQVERAEYDDILLRHAESMGTEVREETMVRTVNVDLDADRITGLTLEDGTTLTARHYVDASGHVGLIRRAMGVGSEAPPELRNVAFWDYWENAEWFVEIGNGGTRVQVRSLPHGWIWFIPLGPTKASVGFICPSEYYKQTGKSPKEVYHEALAEQPEIRHLLRNAESATGGEVLSIKNWSHLSDRLAGANWWICGEAAGFADPILAAGMTLAQGSAREMAYSLLEADRSKAEADTLWVKDWYDTKTRTNINQHIRFAKYWYAANANFTDLQAHCSKIAKDAGLRLNPQQAWRWLAQGGFTNQNLESVGFGTFDLASAKSVLERFTGSRAKFALAQFNEFKINLSNAEEIELGSASEGRVDRIPCYRRADAILPKTGYWRIVTEALKTHTDSESLFRAFGQTAGATSQGMLTHFQILEAMLSQGWVVGKLNKKRPVLDVRVGGRRVRSAAEAAEALKDAKATITFNVPESATDPAD